MRPPARRNCVQVTFGERPPVAAAAGPLALSELLVPGYQRKRGLSSLSVLGDQLGLMWGPYVVPVLRGYAVHGSGK